ncbi:hypothetical protein FRC19_007772 [Serendipita sp. 401]|nr:hypothetical protein FRC19_007772 [Serendipita sp. 401]
MACQGTPTLTQYTTSLSTSYPERTIFTTEYVTITAPARFRVRQDPSPSSTPDPSTSSEQSFGINDVTSIVRTITLTDTVVVANTVPALTLYAPCSTITSETSSSTSASNSSAVRDVDEETSPGARLSTGSDGKATTTSNGATIILTEFVTTVNGVQTIYATPIQTLLNTSDGVLSDSQRIGVITGAAVGGVALLVILLGIIFYLRRARRAKQRLLAEQQKRQPRHFLEDEADDFDLPPHMAQWDARSLTTGSSTSAPRLLRARGSQTGSLFHENVWPPPNEVMEDPLVTHQDLGSSISLAMSFPIDSLTQQDGAVSSTLPASGSIGRRERSSAYDSLLSTDSVEWNRSHSRAESADPLLDSAGRATSPSPLPIRPVSSTSQTMGRGRDSRRSNLRVSYTADEFGQGTSRHLHQGSSTGNAYSSSPIPLQVDYLTSSSSGGIPITLPTQSGDLVRDVLQVGSRGGTPFRQEEIPPQYHTIPTDNR